MDPNAHPLKDIANPGVKAEHDLAKTLRGEVARLLGRSQYNFPGAQPVSFSRKHLNELRREDYYVCEKSDGIRYLLYLTQDDNNRECQYLIDRKNDYWFLHQRNMHFPLPGNPGAFHVDTLIDGELVMDDLPNGGKEPKFLVFDLLCLDGKAELLSRPLDKRLGYFKEQVMKPYKQLFAEYPDEQKYMAFKVEMKEMQFSYGIEMMFRQVLPSLKHENDGLIFTCRTSPYQFGTDPHILKWKAPHHNTVDFRLKMEFPTVEPNELERADGMTKPFVDYDSVPEAKLLVFTGSERGQANYDVFQDPLYITEDEWEELKGLEDPLQMRVIECCLDKEKRWRLYKFRDDKNEANHVSTVSSVLESIKDGVSEEELLVVAPGIKAEWKKRNGGH